MLADILLVVAVIAIVWVSTVDADHDGTAALEASRRRLIGWQAEEAERTVRHLTNQAVLAMLDEVRQQADHRQ